MINSTKRPPRFHHQADRLRPPWLRAALLPLLVALAAAFGASPARASTAFGDLNNFDVFNDTGTECHGFEIELEDIHSADLTYTYDWNHYGAPRITEDTSDPAHPKVFVRYAATFDPASGTFSAFTAMPSSPPSPTDGHQCTNPTVNFGCEHFGVGYYGAPTVIRYHWLIEDPLAPGNLVHGPAVNVSTPSWTYYPPAPGQIAQVQAAILAPPPPPAPVYEFGDAVWVKAIVTTSHNSNVVELKDLVSDDPDDPNDTNWTNGEPDEVEVEWHILQTEFSNPAAVNNELDGAPEELPNGDEVVTRRYEFYKYSGPLDPETNEAKCDNYPQISDPADPSYKAECDPATTTVLGDYIGAQMAGFNVEAVLGLIDHVQDGDLDVDYPARTVVVGGNTPYVTQITSGALPAGLTLDSATGVLSGAPTAAGQFLFTVTATDADGVQATKSYTMNVLGGDGGDNCPDDPAKTEPGLCGCGVPDTDSDGDGTPDCSDLCPADAAKTDPGACGCGITDTDSDADGTPDCNDQCPIDPAKTDPGTCGCGVPDLDSNGNGVADCLEAQADLGLAITASATSVSVKKKVQYGLTVTNAGPDVAEAVISISATLSGVPLKNVQVPKGCSRSGGVITCTLGSLAPGTAVTKTITVTPSGSGTLTVTATVASPTLDPNGANQSATVETTVN